MNKIDRFIFFFIGLGIWTLVMTHAFNSEKVNAAKTGATRDSPNITAVTRPYPSGIINLNGDEEITDCQYLLTIPHDQLVSKSNLFQ